MEQRAAVLNISPRDDVSMVSSSSDREAPFRRSPHHLLQVEQQEELLRKWQKQKQYQSQLKEQMSERYDQDPMLTLKKGGLEENVVELRESI
tara:strand:- start:194 stop:469 length:276 start_codon:yes stop_codon:yes gene_type:complete